MGRAIRQTRLWLLPVLLLAGGALIPPGAFGAVTVSPGFTVTPFAAALHSPTALALGPPGAFDGRLYVVEAAGRLLALDPSGQGTLLAEGFAPGAGLVFSAGGLWGDFAYMLGTYATLVPALQLLRVGPTGTLERISLPPGGARAPGGLAFSPGGSGAEALYLSDAGTGELLRLDPTGTASVVGKGLPGPRALAFAPSGSPFADALYVVAGSSVLRLGTDGQASALAANLGVPGAMAFGTGDAFGTDLYVVEGGLSGNRILRVSPNGTIMPVAEGFGVLAGLTFAPAGPLGPALFVAEYNTGTLYRITPVQP